MMDGMRILRKKLLSCMDYLARFARQYKDLPTLGFTHFQPAQLTTVGKRACLWLQDLLLDLEELDDVINAVRLRGAKGTTGTQASFLTLFDGDHEKVKELDRRIVEKLGYQKAYPITSQTYPRKLDSRVLNALSSIAQSTYKFSNDIRLLQHMKEIEEPFEKHQIGSSAMAYKRNPMRSERISSLARYVVVNSLNPAITASTQWFERTLDDSANKRLSVPQGFLAADSILNLSINVVNGLAVYPKVIRKHIDEELPFMATEYILMEAVKKGGDRQELHEKIRVYSMTAGANVKEKGEPNNLTELIAADPAFGFSKEELDKVMEPANFIGRAPEQVDDFLTEYVEPILSSNRDQLGVVEELKV
jgi:adenylosuccinate lyase